MTRVVLLRVLFAVCLLLGCAAAVRAQDEAAPAELADSVSELEFDASQKALLELYNQHKLASAAEVDSEQEAEFDSQLEAEEANMDQLEAEEQSEDDASLISLDATHADSIGETERAIAAGKCAATPKRKDCKALYCKLRALHRRVARKKRQAELEDQIAKLKAKIADQRAHCTKCDREPKERRLRREEEEHQRESARRKKKNDEERARQEAREKAEHEERQRRRREREAAQEKKDMSDREAQRQRERDARRRAREARAAAKLAAIRAQRRKNSHLKVLVHFHPNGDVHFPHHRHSWTPAQNATRPRFASAEEGEEAYAEGEEEMMDSESAEAAESEEDAQLSYIEMEHPDDANLGRWPEHELPARCAAAHAVLKALLAQLAQLEAQLRALLAKPAIGFECPKVVHSPFGFRTAAASGDPHFDTYDGAHHDTMIAGWFTWAQNSVINVQAYSQLGCMPPQYPNTCLRSTVVRITPPGTGETLTVSWGIWPPTGTTHNVVIHDSTNPGANVNVPLAQLGSRTFLHGKYMVSNRGNLVIQPIGEAVADPELAVSVTLGTYYMAVTLPNIAPHRGHTNGLLGAYPGHGNRNDLANIFRKRDGSAVAWNAYAWAASFVVTGAHGPNPPIDMSLQRPLHMFGYLNAHMQGIRHTHTFAFLEQSAESSNSEVAMIEQGDSFDPTPSESKPLVLLDLPVKPKPTQKELDFCHAMLDPGNKQKLAEIRAKSKPLTAEQLKQVKDKMDAQLASCLTDAKAPSVAKSVGAVIKVAKAQQKTAKKALKKVVKKRAAVAEAKKAAVAAAEDAQPFEEPIIYNTDSPVSEDDKRLIALAHQNVVVTHVPLLAQDDLDRAQFMVDDAEKAKRELLTQYPTLE